MHSETFIPQGTLICPRCHSNRVTTKDYAKTICGATGMAGAQTGSLIDTHLLQNCICHQCGLHFSQPLQKGE